MKNLKRQTIESAPDGSRTRLRAIQNNIGFIPNLMAMFANSPAVLNGYASLEAAWEQCHFDAKERQIILLTVSVENRCLYCVAAHATVLKGMGVGVAIVKAIRNKERITDEKLSALVGLVRELVTERGFVTASTRERFIDAGYDEVRLMELLVGVALKTISNYLDHLTPMSIDAAFEAETH